ncbi:MAG TPA: MarR family transcriptional regulator [Candidatus Acidoferrales bacterium]|nr:MarR family transcriptional regulator [Candidatus Acidoferrales bacterium]
MKRYPSQRDKTLRAFRVYVEVMDTAAWMRSWMKGPLQTFDLTPQGFRLLILLCENGPMRMMEISRQMRFQRQNLDAIVRRLEERGWIKRVLVDLPTETGERKGSRTRAVATPKRRWGVGVITLTPEGERFVARVFPNHAKVVKALTRALHGREQQTLVEICRKLRAGAILKFMSEIAHLDEWEMASQPIVQEGHGKADVARSSLLQPPDEDDDASEDEEAPEEAISEADRKRLPGILAKMRRYTILKDARNVDWNKPFDEKRWAGNVVEMLMRVGNDTERKMIAQWRQRMSSGEIVKMLKEEMGGKE